jgi:hypothetical protein
LPFFVVTIIPRAGTRTVDSRWSGIFQDLDDLHVLRMIFAKSMLEGVDYRQYIKGSLHCWWTVSLIRIAGWFTGCQLICWNVYRNLSYEALCRFPAGMSATLYFQRFANAVESDLLVTVPVPITINSSIKVAFSVIVT